MEIFRIILHYKLVLCLVLMPSFIDGMATEEYQLKEVVVITNNAIGGNHADNHQLEDEEVAVINARATRINPEDITGPGFRERINKARPYFYLPLVPLFSYTLFGIVSTIVTKPYLEAEPEYFLPYCLILLGTAYPPSWIAHRLSDRNSRRTRVLDTIEHNYTHRLREYHDYMHQETLTIPISIRQQQEELRSDVERLAKIENSCCWSSPE